MRIAKTIVLLLIAVLMSQPVAAKSRKVFKSGNWTGMAVYQKSGRFAACTIIARYVSGTLIAMSVTPSNSWVIALKRKGGYPSGRQFATRLYIDKKLIHRGTARSLKSGIVRLPIPGTKKVINALRQGRVLRLVTSGGSSSYKLSGTRAAIARMIRCAIRRGKSSIGTVAKKPAGDAFSNPGNSAFSDRRRSAFSSSSSSFALSGRKPLAVSSRKIPRDKLVVFASNFLARAGFTGFQIMPHDKFKKVADVVWKLPDGSLGTLSAYRSDSNVSLAGVAGGVIGSATQTCKGDFASGKRKSDIQNGMEIHRLFASCNETAKPFEAQYSLIKMLNGDIVKIAHLRMGRAAASMDPAQMQRTEKALLRTVKTDPNVLR